MTQRERHEAEGLFTLKKTPGEGMCLVKGCRKHSAKGKVGLCHCHHQYRWRMNDRKRSAYTTLRDHAKARGLAFTISYDYFLGLTDAVAYWDHEAESRGDVLTIDRVDATRGYEPSNVRVISLSQNVIAGNRIRHLPAYVQSILERKRQRVVEQQGFPDDDRDPF